MGANNFCLIKTTEKLAEAAFSIVSQSLSTAAAMINAKLCSFHPVSFKV
jgi:hypothetical protein